VSDSRNTSIVSLPGAHPFHHTVRMPSYFISNDMHISIPVTAFHANNSMFGHPSIASPSPVCHRDRVRLHTILLPDFHDSCVEEPKLPCPREIINSALDRCQQASSKSRPSAIQLTTTPQRTNLRVQSCLQRVRSRTLVPHTLISPTTHWLCHLGLRLHGLTVVTRIHHQIGATLVKRCVLK
jgi:hypothetical protein